MDLSDSALDGLASRLSAIFATAEASFDTKDLDPLLLDLLDYIQAHPEKRPEFEAVICSLVQIPTDGRHLPGFTEVVEFTMHTLRWENVRSCIEVARQIDLPQSDATELNRRHRLNQLLEAFADDWPGGDIYRHYRDGVV